MGELEGLCSGVVLDHVPKGVEPISNMTERANTWWGEAVISWIKAQNAAGQGTGQESAEGRRDVLIVSHGGLIGILLHGLRKGTIRVEKGARLTKCMNASITVIEIDSVTVKGKIIQYSDTSHLTGPMVEENVDVQDAPPNL